MKYAKPLAFFLAFAIAADISSSFQASGQNYNLPALIVSSGGDIVNGSNYKSYVAAGIISGTIASEGYNNFLGFFYTWKLANGQPCTTASQCEGGYCCSNLCAGSRCPEGLIASGGTSGGGEGAGGGGGGFFTPKKEFSVSPGNIKAKAALGESAEMKLKIKNKGNIGLIVSLKTEGITEYLSLSETFFDLKAGEEAEITLSFTGRRVGSFTGEITAKADELEESVPVIFEVISEKILFDVKLDVPAAYEKVEPGDELKTQITLLNVGAPEKVDVFAAYFIKDLRGNILYEETETFAVEKQLSYSKPFKINENTMPGDYVVGIEVRYADSFAVSSQFFQVVEKKDIVAMEKIAKNATMTALIAFILVGVVAMLIAKLASISKKKGKRRK